MRKIIWVLTVILAILLSSCGDKDARVVVITLDGLRWQELYTGADSLLVSNPRFVSNPGDLQSKYWRPAAAERRSALMPFTWSYIASHGYMLGNRLKGSQFQVSNKMNFSYPGYSEMFCGWADDERINSNDAKPNPNTSVLEAASNDPRYKGRVMVYGSWESTRYAVNNERGGFPGSVAYEEDIASSATSELNLINDMQEFMPKLWGGERFDAFTYAYALETMKKDHPKVIWISFGETDEWAHEGKYDFYLDAAHATDGMIRNIVEYCESDPFYKGKTTYLLTTDHGRGNKSSFTSHGSGVRGSQNTWMMAFGKGIEPLGETSSNGPLYTCQFASTIADILGIDFTPGNGVKQAPVDPRFKGEPVQEAIEMTDAGYFHEVDARPKGNGVRFKYYEGFFTGVGDLAKARVVDSGLMKDFSIDAAKVEDNFGYEFNSLLKIPASGRYTISLCSDDGAKVYLDDKLVIDNDGKHGQQTKGASMAMDAGFHRLKVLYYEDVGGETLEVGLKGEGMEYEIIPSSMLYYE